MRCVKSVLVVLALLAGAAVLGSHGAEGFVETLRVGKGLEEEAAARVVVHHEVPGCDTFARRSRASGWEKRPRVMYAVGVGRGPGVREKQPEAGAKGCGGDRGENTEDGGKGRARREKSHTPSERVREKPQVWGLRCDGLRLRGNRRSVDVVAGGGGVLRQ